VRCPSPETGLLLLLAALAGCAPSVKSIRDHPFPAGEVLRRVQERNEQVKTLKGNGTITVEAPEGSNSSYFDASLKKPDSLLVEFKGPFGIHVGTLLLCREQFIFLNRMENKAIIGKPDGRTLQSMFRLKMEFDEILNVFTGEFPPASAGDSLARFSVEDDRYVMRYAEGTGAKEYQIDGDDFVVTSYRVADSSGTPSVTATASRIDDSPPVAVPRLLRVIFPGEKRSITIAYSGVEVNKPVDCSLTIPERTEIIRR
jgi:outer membrane lipoprotein-sorting protein